MADICDPLVKPTSVCDSLVKPTRVLKKNLRLNKDRFGFITNTNSEQMQKAINLAQMVAPTNASVLLMGESGTGKDVMANYIHEISKCAQGPMIAINCAALPANMLEAILFGYEKGAFTGAYVSSPGKFEQAQGGTIFLDEIAELNLDLQAKLLRVLQNQEVERLGGKKLIALNVRVIAACNRDLHHAVINQKFRSDLYYRLSVFPIKLPSLRDRIEDLPGLVNYLIDKHSRAFDLQRPEVSNLFWKKLQKHSWPGNVRELENVVQRALIINDQSMLEERHILFDANSEPGLDNNIT